MKIEHQLKPVPQIVGLQTVHNHAIWGIPQIEGCWQLRILQSGEQCRQISDFRNSPSLLSKCSKIDQNGSHGTYLVGPSTDIRAGEKYFHFQINSFATNFDEKFIKKFNFQKLTNRRPLGPSIRPPTASWGAECFLVVDDI